MVGATRLELIARKHAVEVLKTIWGGTTRFNEILTKVPMSPKSLMFLLRDLVSAKILKTEAIPVQIGFVKGFIYYKMTPLGERVLDLAVQILEVK